MATDAAIDQEKLGAFMEKLIGDVSGTMVTLMCVLGDRLGLFKDLARNGPATSDELAERAGVNGRYAREWLEGLAAAGYLEHEPSSGRYLLPAEHAEALAREGGSHFVGGIYQQIPEFVMPIDQLTRAFRQGGGVPASAFSEGFWEGMERFTGAWFDNLLLQEWIPASPVTTKKLEDGALLADVGCGSGKAVIKLAQAFPSSRFVGYDVFEGQIARATANAEAAGVADRVSFVQIDVGEGLPEQYDVITTFDVVHDAVDPLGLVRSIRAGLEPDGIYLILEINCANNAEDNAGPLGALLYGISIFYCMTTSLAHNGEGLGTVGLPEGKVRALCTEAGFSAVRRLPPKNPFNILYEATP